MPFAFALQGVFGSLENILKFYYRAVAPHHASKCGVNIPVE